ncbi:NUDIX domain-containing protein [Micromonospora sp. WMMC250]|uniref:NUDIX domain-containing protein n=1 Tax=Micromonospora sp. WMMC250 TaxID=3014781 RepID=UPI0022B68204|nr:NUDIX domain-containing protein [Micromonospora sp. WMMC250]MCZ7375270.1 NUDIX domain-containing protein [Micromonospora sp. WMMC250]
MGTRDHAVLRLAVDLVILTVREDQLQILIIERGNPPFAGRPALPGGFLRGTEDPLAAAHRELREETGLSASGLHLEQLPVAGAPDRDPRGRVVSVPYLAIAPNLPMPIAGSDASGARWRPLDSLEEDGHLAFDHDEILQMAIERARIELEHTTLAAAFCAEPFTIGQLRGVYEAVWGGQLDPRNFSRKVIKTEGFVVATGEKRLVGTGRPAALYRRGSATRLHPAMLRADLGPPIHP